MPEYPRTLPCGCREETVVMFDLRCKEHNTGPFLSVNVSGPIDPGEMTDAIKEWTRFTDAYSKREPGDIVKKIQEYERNHGPNQRPAPSPEGE